MGVATTSNWLPFLSMDKFVWLLYKKGYYSGVLYNCVQVNAMHYKRLEDHHVLWQKSSPLTSLVFSAFRLTLAIYE